MILVGKSEAVLVRFVQLQQLGKPISTLDGLAEGKEWAEELANHRDSDIRNFVNCWHNPRTHFGLHRRGGAVESAIRERRVLVPGATEFRNR